MKKVIALDDHPVVLAGLQTMLSTHYEVSFCGGFTRLPDVLDWLEHHTADVLLLDIHLGDQDGIQICKELRIRFPALRILALSNLDQTVIVRQMMKNGADGYLLKNAHPDELFQAIFSTAPYIQPGLREILLRESIGMPARRQEFIPVLTRREREVLDLIAREHTTKEIAQKLFISSDTVETHRGHLFQKLGVKNAAGLIKTAIEKGLI